MLASPQRNRPVKRKQRRRIGSSCCCLLVRNPLQSGLPGGPLPISVCLTFQYLVNLQPSPFSHLQTCLLAHLPQPVCPLPSAFRRLSFLRIVRGPSSMRLQRCAGNDSQYDDTATLLRCRRVRPISSTITASNIVQCRLLRTPGAVWLLQ